MKDIVLFSVTKVVDDECGGFEDLDFTVTEAGRRYAHGVGVEGLMALKEMADAAINAMLAATPSQEPIK